MWPNVDLMMGCVGVGDRAWTFHAYIFDMKAIGNIKLLGGLAMSIPFTKFFPYNIEFLFMAWW